MENTQQTIIIKTQKSAGVAALLGFFFGPLGMLYATGWGALIMFIVTGIIIFITAGLGLIITNPICAIWAYMSVKNKNVKDPIVNTNTVVRNTNKQKDKTVEKEDLFN